MKFTIGVAAVLFSLAGTAYAGSAYVGAGVLEGYADLPSFTGVISGYNVSLTGDKNTDTGYKVYAGYNVTEYWGVEIGYNDLGSEYSVKGTVNGIPFTSSGIKAYNYYAALTGTLPIYDQFSVNGKLGWVENKVEIPNVCAQGTCVSVSDSSSRSDLLFGVGVSYAFTPNWAAQLEYENYGKMSKDDMGIGAAKGSAAALSARYTF